MLLEEEAKKYKEYQLTGLRKFGYWMQSFFVFCFCCKKCCWRKKKSELEADQDPIAEGVAVDMLKEKMAGHRAARKNK